MPTTVGGRSSCEGQWPEPQPLQFELQLEFELPFEFSRHPDAISWHLRKGCQNSSEALFVSGASQMQGAL